MGGPPNVYIYIYMHISYSVKYHNVFFGLGVPVRVSGAGVLRFRASGFNV